ncbi:hypothetical protein HPB51_025941 [Rhipicephalus microplus]|uniref:DDE-1 domain-containing protein n=1 Tax=Rhipicephalus microplus TaxID=6941 RepID=A0A9J6EEP9_RHIMP|nr:hypothetical protein HPB51_025941 [Rhipicephalus microplus]
MPFATKLKIINRIERGEKSDVASTTSCNIQLCFSPPNTTSVLQPLDQGIICALKSGYRKCLVERLLQNLRVGRELKIDLLGALSMLSRLWTDVMEETMQKCFRHASFRMP